MFKKLKIICAAIMLMLPASSRAEMIEISSIDWCPFICPDDPDKPGFLSEYVDEIYKNSGVLVRKKKYSWSRAIYNTERGVTDALLSPAKNEAPQLIFPEIEIGSQKLCFFVNKGDKWRFTGNESLKTKRVIYPQNVLPDSLREFWGSPLFVDRPYDGEYAGQAARLLLKDRTDTFLMTYYSTIHDLKKEGLRSKIQEAGCLEPQKLYLAFSPHPEKKEHVESLMVIFNEGIKKLREEKFLEKLLVKYGLEDKVE